eukprot:gene3247-6427_t
MLGPLEAVDSLSVNVTLLQRQISKDVIEPPPSPVNVLMIGTGEYTTGYVHGKSSDSDKGAGVVALTMFDLRRRGKVGRLGLCGVNGSKFPGIRSHMKTMIADVYMDIDISVETYPRDSECNANAYEKAIEGFFPGDAVTIFTPDDTHYDIAMACVERGLHVIISKPAVLTLAQHRSLCVAAEMNNVLLAVEVHKRWDPMYVDARDRIQTLGPFSYMYSYMSQPKHQLKTFSAWAGRNSDISYYLNTHHIDFHEWTAGETSRPVRVTASASSGVADAVFGKNCEDTITLTVLWENLTSPTPLPSPPPSSHIVDGDNINGSNSDSSSSSGSGIVGAGYGTAVYTSSWIAPRSDVHSQQRFFYMGQKGEISIDQAHRGYTMAADEGTAGLRSLNPLFMKYTPSDGKFAGQNGYGYRSLEHFIDAVAAANCRNRGPLSPLSRSEELGSTIATMAKCYRTTAVLEAGRRSLDNDGKPVRSPGLAGNLIAFMNHLIFKTSWKITGIQTAAKTDKTCVKILGVFI